MFANKAFRFGTSLYFIAVCLLVFINPSQVHGKYLTDHQAQLNVHNSTADSSLCIYYYPYLHSLPSSQSNCSLSQVVDLRMWDGCSNLSFPLANYARDKFALVNNTICPVDFQANHLEWVGGLGLLLVTRQVLCLDANQTLRTNIPVVLIGENSARHLLEFGPEAQACLWVPPEGALDVSMLIIWLMAVITVTIGAYWSGLVRYELQQSAYEVSIPGTIAAHPPNGNPKQTEEVALSVTPIVVGFAVVCMCGVLLLLYFFFSYLVYIIIGLFTIAATSALYQCLEPLVRKLPVLTARIPMPCVSLRLEIRQILLLCGCLAMGVCWLVFRKREFSWILQDILGIAFSINMLKVVRLPSLKICTLLLVLLFFYDIFFVFITPYFTRNGESIMVDVATGGSSGADEDYCLASNGSIKGATIDNGAIVGVPSEEQLPMVLRVPRLLSSSNTACNQGRVFYSLLGFGDILVPGMLVAYCHGVDMVTNPRTKAYYVTSLLAYGLGMLATFAGLYLMSQAQPALLYLVPFTLGAVFALAAARKEFSLLWNGDGWALVEESRQLRSTTVEPVQDPNRSVCSTSSSCRIEADQEASLIP